MGKGSYRYCGKETIKRATVTMAITATVVISISGYSVHKGMLYFAQAKSTGNIVKQVKRDGLTLELFSTVPELKRSMIFEEDVELCEPTKARMMVHEDVEDTYEIKLMGIDVPLEVVEDEDVLDIESEILEQYGISSSCNVTIGDEIGVGSSTKREIKPGSHTSKGSTLLDVRRSATKIDETYKSKPIKLTKGNRDLVARLVQGEAGVEGFIGAALVAQTIRDTMVYDGVYDLMTIKRSHGYCGGLSIDPNKDVLDAVEFIFDKGGYVVQHNLMYFYAYKTTVSKFHETQDFILEHEGHRFFAKIEK